MKHSNKRKMSKKLLQTLLLLKHKLTLPKMLKLKKLLKLPKLEPTKLLNLPLREKRISRDKRKHSRNN